MLNKYQPCLPTNKLVCQVCCYTISFSVIMRQIFSLSLNIQGWDLACKTNIFRKFMKLILQDLLQVSVDTPLADEDNV